jgi:dynein heavy chain
MVFQILLTNKEIDIKELEFLLRYPYVPNLTSPVDFLNDQSWGGIKSLSSMEEFHNLDRDIEGRRMTFNIYKFEELFYFD